MLSRRWESRVPESGASAGPSNWFGGGALERPATRTSGVMAETARRGGRPVRRRWVELVWGVVIVEVRDAHIWFDGGNGPMKRPTDPPPVPEGLNWDLWLGPAESRPYSPAYVPASWRSWRAFGSGIVGDFACH